jgi:chromobox protein 5
MTPQFYVKWKGYPDSANTWEPLGNLEGCHDILREFLITTFTTNLNALTQTSGSGEQSGSVSASVSPSGSPPPVAGSSKKQRKLKNRQTSQDMVVM